jgi:5-methylcytosine-specific restriction endonuclease McrA
MTPALVRRRNSAFSHQSGRCYYCERPMWRDNPLEFAAKYRITPRQARTLWCTAEHLVARQDGGSNSGNNIVAACLFCNSQRHKRKIAPPPGLYKQQIRKRIDQGGWDSALM